MKRRKRRIRLLGNQKEQKKMKNLRCGKAMGFSKKVCDEGIEKRTERLRLLIRKRM
jgi:hypothetical protein